MSYENYHCLLSSPFILLYFKVAQITSILKKIQLSCLLNLILMNWETVNIESHTKVRQYDLRLNISPMNIHNRIWVENVWCVNSMLQIIHRCRNILLFANMTMWLVVIVQSDSKIKALLISSFWGWPGKNTKVLEIFSNTYKTFRIQYFGWTYFAIWVLLLFV